MLGINIYEFEDRKLYHKGEEFHYRLRQNLWTWKGTLFLNGKYIKDFNQETNLEKLCNDDFTLRVTLLHSGFNSDL